MHISSSPKIGLGTAAIGRPGYINLGHAQALGSDTSVKAMEQHAHTVFDKAVSLGIDYFDAARSYGKAEAFISSWLKKNPTHANQIDVGSKWGYTYTANWQTQAEAHEVKEHSLSKLNDQWKLSQDLLPELRLYQIHSATFATGVLENKEIHHRLHTLREEHGIAIGLSTSGVDQVDLIKAALDVEVDGRRLFDAVQVTYNMLEQSTAEALSQAKQAGLTVIIKEALANGRLSPANQDWESMGLLQQLADDHHVGVDAVALAFVLAQPFVDIVLSGAASIAHLESNVKARDLVLSDKAMASLTALGEDSNTYWRYRSSLAWN